VLNPDTNSLSPSEKSKGARFISAQSLINIKKKIGEKNSNSVKLFIKKKKFKLFKKNRTENIKILKLTSKEIDCEIERILPKKGNLELEDQPCTIIKYTDNPIQTI